MLDWLSAVTLAAAAAATYVVLALWLNARKFSHAVPSTAGFNPFLNLVAMVKNLDRRTMPFYRARHSSHFPVLHLSREAHSDQRIVDDFLCIGAHTPTVPVNDMLLEETLAAGGKTWALSTPFSTMTYLVVTDPVQRCPIFFRR